MMDLDVRLAGYPNTLHYSSLLASSQTSSRLVVLSLPRELTPADLEAHFARLGPGLTDARILHTKDGRPRQMGFVGFQTVEQATRAKDWYDGTWFKGARLRIDFALARAGSTVRLVGRDQVNLADSTVRVLQVGSRNESGRPSPKRTRIDDHDSEDDGLLRGRSRSGAARSSALSELSIPKAPNAGLPPTDGSLDSDVQYLVSRRKQHTACSDRLADSLPLRSPPNDELLREFNPVAVSVDNTPLVETQSAANDARLFLRNLSFDVHRDDLDSAFSPFGTIRQIHIPSTAGGAHPKGIAFITFDRAEAAMQARAALDGTPLKGRVVQVIFATNRMITANTGEGSEQLHGGAETADSPRQRWKEAGVQRTQLYANADAANTVMAGRFAMTKANLLAANSSHAAVRQNLAESYLLKELRDYLEEHGVDVDRLGTPSGKLSDTTLLFRNLPSGTTLQTLRHLLSACSVIVSELVVTPSGTLAVMKTASMADTSNIIKRLSYTRLQSAIVYVERAPEGTWPDRSSTAALDSVSVPTQSISPTQPSATDCDSSVFVKNLRVPIDRDQLRICFAHLAGFVTVRIVPPASGESGSFGRAYIAFATQAAASSAVAAMNGYVYAGQPLSCSLAKRSLLANDSVSQLPIHGDKLILKNIPFETSKQELMILMSVYGDVRSLRLPRKADNTTRGFAFVQYATQTQAEAARLGLRDSHLLGRRLIIESSER